MSKVSAIEPDLRVLSPAELLMVAGAKPKEEETGRYTAPKPLEEVVEICTTTRTPFGARVQTCKKIYSGPPRGQAPKGK